MALRIRVDGRVLCAAMHEPEAGDVYLDDGAHYTLSVERGLLVTEPMWLEAHSPSFAARVAAGEANRGGHAAHGQWWWTDEVPADVMADMRFVPVD